MRKLNKLKFFVGLIIIPMLVLLGLFLLLGDNLEVIRRSLEGNQSADEIRSILSELGIRGKLTISILAMLQVVMMFLPAEPIQVLGGLSFGFSAGLLYCLIGVFAGNTLIFLLYKFYGERLRNFFDKELNIDLECTGRSIRLLIAVFMLYLLPAIPYGMIAFLAAGAGMKYLRFICITTLGALPSICLGVGFGHIALESSLLVTFIVFLALVAILVIAIINREKLIAAVNEYLNEGKRKNLAVREYKSRKLNLPYFIFRLLVFGKVKFKVVRTVENIERPCIVLCNHGAFIDFAYAGTVLKKESPNFIVNRMYFYEKYFGELLRSFGCFPKSIFAADTDSAMNCIRVIKRGGVLAMMPEARLSTVGRFEDIQDSTFDFLKKMGVTVYVIKIGGDYLAKPKWGSGLRRGSLVEADMSLLFTPDELSALSVSEIEERTKNALYYNELEWLEKHPEINYRSKKMAEGLENILTRCPKCGARYSLKTRGKRLYCEKCDLSCELDSRYSFGVDAPFKNFVEWYDWQFDKLREEISANPEFCLTSAVELKHASKDGKTQLVSAGRGVCTLSREGLVYVGTEYGEEVRKEFPISTIYRLLFGSGVNFELYVGKEIYFFVPHEKRSCVDWYIASIIFTDIYNKL